MEHKSLLVVACITASVLMFGCQNEEKTTEAPAMTTKAPAKATEAPAMTTKAPAKATEAPAMTTKVIKPAENTNISTFSPSLPTALAGKSIVASDKATAGYLNNNKMEEKVAATIKSEDGFELRGWAVDDSTKSVPDVIFIELAPVKGGEKYYAVASRCQRLDVVKFFEEPAYNKAGYVVKADIKVIPPGEYKVNVIQIVDDKAILTSTNRNINKIN